MTEHYSIIMARKPLSEKTVADNVLKWGTGGINIDGCRVGMSDDDIETNTKKASKENNGVNFDVAEGKSKGTATLPNTQGRFPANIIFDEEAGKILDNQSGTVRMASNVNGIEHHSKMNFTPGEESKVKMKQVNVPETKGGASRFFYQPKTDEEFDNNNITKNDKEMNITLLQGDCLDKLKELEDNSVDSVVTDPPYEIGFMGKGWDDSGIANNPELWKEVLRVLKPGGHLLSFSHSRTYHRQAVAVEDAGFEIRDQILWIYGSGFPKSHNIGKAVDKLQGNEREVVGETKGKGYSSMQEKNLEQGNRPYVDGLPYEKADRTLTKGNSDWEGWGTALKPAHEPIVMARKPLSEKTVAQNVLEWGTGGINIDGCRIGTDEDTSRKPTSTQNSITYGKSKMMGGNGHSEGRFPANIIFDEEAGKILDEQSGVSKSSVRKGGKGGSGIYEGGFGDGATGGFTDTGGASRFFYCPKASKKDRNEGCDELEEKVSTQQFMGGMDNIMHSDGSIRKNAPILNKNSHPTVKPTDLMAYLIRLVTPKGGIVLDPFMGSGSTGKAAVREGFDFIGIEREDEYMEIAKTRIEYEQKKNKHRQFFDE